MVLAGLCAALLSAAPLSAADAEAFRGDTDIIVGEILKSHPAPFAHADKNAFLKDVAAVKADGPGRGLGCAIAELTALVATLNDGDLGIRPPSRLRHRDARFRFCGYRHFAWGSAESRVRCGNQPTATIARPLRDRAALLTAFERDPDAACLELH